MKRVARTFYFPLQTNSMSDINDTSESQGKHKERLSYFYYNKNFF